MGVWLGAGQARPLRGEWLGPRRPRPSRSPPRVAVSNSQTLTNPFFDFCVVLLSSFLAALQPRAPSPEPRAPHPRPPRRTPNERRSGSSFGPRTGPRAPRRGPRRSAFFSWTPASASAGESSTSAPPAPGPGGQRFSSGRRRGPLPPICLRAPPRERFALDVASGSLSRELKPERHGYRAPPSHEHRGPSSAFRRPRVDPGRARFRGGSRARLDRGRTKGWQGPGIGGEAGV